MESRNLRYKKLIAGSRSVAVFASIALGKYLHSGYVGSFLSNKSNLLKKRTNGTRAGNLSITDRNNKRDSSNLWVVSKESWA